MSGLKKPNISLGLYCIVILFNLSSWIDFSGVWAELPLLVPRLPEGWALPSQLTICSQIAVIGPLVYFIANTIKPGLIKEEVVVYAVITVGFIGCTLLIFFWDKTVVIAGQSRSVALFALTFVLAFTDNCSTIVFLSYFAILPAGYLSAYYVGEALCGFIPSIASLIQGSGDYDCVNVSTSTNATSLLNTTYQLNHTGWEITPVMRPPTFSIGFFFGILAAIMATSGISFTFLNYHPWCKKYHVKTPGDVRATDKCGKKLLEKKAETNEEHKQSFDKFLYENETKVTVDEILSVKPFMSTRMYVFLLLQYGYLQAFRYGLLYNVQSYSLLPYGPLAYGLGNRLTTVVQTMSCVFALYFPTRSVKLITTCTIVGTIPSVFILVFACLSPDPPFKDTTGGMILILFAWLTMSTLWGYCKVGIAVLMKEQGKRQLMMTGAAEVIILCLVSVMIFVLVNFAQVFEEPPQCPY